MTQSHKERKAPSPLERVAERFHRSSSLDALRGLAIIGMVLSGTIAETLPAWMYHAQVGPRSGFNFDPTIFGITWVDLVFPFFLFAMGTAIPLALSSKLDKGAKIQSLLPSILKRVFLLVFFAVAIYHTNPYRLDGSWNYALAILAFVAGTFLVVPVLALVGLMPHINKLYEISSWLGIAKGLIITGGMMAVTVFTVRKKWFWKT